VLATSANIARSYVYMADIHMKLPEKL